MLEGRLEIQMSGRVVGQQLDLVSHLRLIVTSNLEELMKKVCDALDRFIKDIKRFTYYKLKEWFIYLSNKWSSR